MNNSGIEKMPPDGADDVVARAKRLREAATLYSCPKRVAALMLVISETANTAVSIALAAGMREFEATKALKAWEAAGLVEAEQNGGRNGKAYRAVKGEKSGLGIFVGNILFGGEFL